MSVNPTRMELAKLKKRLKTSQEGHKLLKDKQDELMRTFIASLNEANKLRKKVNQSIRKLSMDVGLSISSFPYSMVKNVFLMKETLVSADIRQHKWMGVSIVDIEYNIKKARPASALVSSPQMAKSVRDMQEVLPDLLRLTVAEKNCGLMASEIEMLRRRVNALEHRIIPDLQKNIRTIKMKLSDDERDTITRLIKVKNLE